MKPTLLLAGVALLDATVSAVAIPEGTDLTSTPRFAERDYAEHSDTSTSFFAGLFKRKGGGGGGSKGGSSSSSSSGESSSSGSSSSSSSSGKSGSSSTSSTSSSSSSSKGLGSTTSSTGGRTKTGSGAPATYGGSYYGGGASVPYRSGRTSTAGLAALPLAFVGTSLLFWPGVWYHPVYIYPYTHPWTYHNATTNSTETKPVDCGCEEYQECGCDENNSTDYINSVLGNGSYNQLNKSLVTVSNVNGTDTILLNGTLPNGTTASGGTESASAGVSLRHFSEMLGYWSTGATVLTMVLLS